MTGDKDAALIDALRFAEKTAEHPMADNLVLVAAKRLYKDGQYVEAERLAVGIIEQHPEEDTVFDAQQLLHAVDEVRQTWIRVPDNVIERQRQRLAGKSGKERTQLERNLDAIAQLRATTSPAILATRDPSPLARPRNNGASRIELPTTTRATTQAAPKL